MLTKEKFQKNGVNISPSFLKPTQKFSATGSKFSLLGFSLLAFTLGACSSSGIIEAVEGEMAADSSTAMENQSTEMAPELSDESTTGTAAGTVSDSEGDPLFGKRQAPVVADKPFEKAGRWMNAYYFVRSSEENWETLSTLIYGRGDRADLLMSWNASNNQPLRVGKVIYYNSALRPDDTTNMKVFSDDFGFAFQQVEVQKGDSLSLIGLKLFGDAQTWREIASLNPQIQNPDLIEPGQILKLQAATFDTKPVFDQLMSQAQMAANASQNENSQSDQISQQAQEVQNAQVATNEITEPENVVPQEANSKKDILIKVIISIIMIMGVAFIIRRRAKAKKAMNQSWENQASVMTKISNQ